MTAVANQVSDPNASGQPPYRSRKPAQFLCALTMADVQRLVEQTGQCEMVVRMARIARQLESVEQHCDSLAELAAVAQPSPASPAPDSLDGKIERLRKLLKEIAPLAADVGATSQDTDMRTLCFDLSRGCHRALAELRRRGLWDEAR